MGFDLQSQIIGYEANKSMMMKIKRQLFDLLLN